MSSRRSCLRHLAANNTLSKFSNEADYITNKLKKLVLKESFRKSSRIKPGLSA